MKFLERNDMEASDVDSLVLGKNGDVRTDFWYDNICDSLFVDQSVYTFKNLVGEYPTSSAFAVYFSSELIKGNKAPEQSILRLNGKSENVLIYNHYKGEQHGLILLKKA